MDGLPLHPVVIHLPMGLAPILPLLALGLGWAVWKDKLPRRAWLVVVVLQALLFGGALVAQEVGEDEEERVEAVVPESAIHEHEEAAEVFVIAAGITLALALGALVLPAAGARAALMGATLLATGVTLGLGIRTGHLGGLLVHRHMVRPEIAIPLEGGGLPSAASADDDD